jgi:hypothetical protein
LRFRAAATFAVDALKCVGCPQRLPLRLGVAQKGEEIVTGFLESRGVLAGDRIAQRIFQTTRRRIQTREGLGDARRECESQTLRRRDGCGYSVRRAMIGSTRVARRAGT